MPEQVKSVSEDSSPGPERSRSELEEELAAAREEILRLRDLLVGKDAELGAARGQAAEAEDRSQRVMNAATRVHSRLPGAMRMIGAVLRRLRGRRG